MTGELLKLSTTIGIPNTYEPWRAAAIDEYGPVLARALGAKNDEVVAALAAGDIGSAERLAKEAYTAPGVMEEVAGIYLKHMIPVVAEQFRKDMWARKSVLKLPEPPPPPEPEPEAPKVHRSVTRVTKHDAQGRIMEMVKEEEIV